MIYYFDIDDTICECVGIDYTTAKPLTKRIDHINFLYDNGNTIIFWTARGTKSGIDWSEITKKQFNDWGVKYHELKFNKPVYDVFVDDKNINADEYFKNL